jgi:WD40 repeat protein
MHFISHSTLDKTSAVDLRDRLLARGYDSQQIFLDSDEDSGIAAGRKWEQVLYERLKDCRALIVLCSPHWQQSKWCFAELVYAKMAGKEVFPVVLADCDLSIASEHQAVFVNREGESAYARLLDTLEARHLGPKDHLPWPHPDLRDIHGQPDDCPFPGLPAFDERYAAVYFGRERETQVLLEELRQMRSKGEPRLLMIVGGSGSGKSSLLMAGVLPRLNVAFRSAKGRSFAERKTTNWLVLPTLRFGRRDYPDALFETLAEEIVAHYPPDAASKGISVPDRKTLRDQFAADDAAQAAKAFLEAARDLTFACGSKDATVLLPVDQFEEFLPPSGGANGTKFLKFLEQVCQHRNDRLLVIGTMRSDYLDVYERQPHALKAPTFKEWRLEPFPREQIANVIVKPAARAHVEVTPELLEQLKQDTPTTDALPLLAFTLEKLYRTHAADKKLDLSEYKSLGGMEGSIKHTAEQIMPANSLPPNVESAVRLSFVKHLAQVNDKGEFVRLTARWKDLDPAAYPILEQFVTQRLLIKSQRDGEVTLEVAHEAIFRSWEQLKTWLGTSADILRWRRDVRRDQTSDKKWHGLRPAQLAVARDWPKRRRNELSDDEVRWIKQGINRQWLLGAMVAFVVSVITAFAGIALWQKGKADEATREAQTQTQIANARRLLALAQVSANKNPERGLLLAVDAIDSMKQVGSSSFPEAESFLRDQLLEVSGRRFSLNFSDTIANTDAAYSNPHRRAVAAFLEQKGLVRLWDDALDNGSRSIQEKPLRDVRHLSFSKDGKYLACVSQPIEGKAEITVWQTDRFGQSDTVPHLRLPNSDGCESLAEFSSDGRFLITCRTVFGVPKKSELLIWSLVDATQMTPIKSLTLGDIPAKWAWLDDREKILVCATGSMLYFWGFDQSQADDWVVKQEYSSSLFMFENDAYGRQALSFAYRRYYTATEVVVGWSDGNIELWRGSDRPLRTFRVHSGPVQTLAINPSGNRLVSGSRDQRVIVWDIDSLNPVNDYVVLRGLESAVAHVSFPNDKTVIGCGQDGIVRIWDEFPYYDPDDARPIHEPREQLAELLKQLSGQELSKRSLSIAGRSLSENEITEFQSDRGGTSE